MIFNPVRRDDTTSTFFDFARDGVFALKRSPSTGDVLDPRAEQDSLGNTALEWMESSGRGQIISWAEVPQRPPAGSIIVAIVQFEEGPWWWTQIIHADPATLSSGSAVLVEFVRSGTGAQDEYVAAFRPAHASITK